MQKQLKVSAIKDGTVIDHIPTKALFKVIKILKLEDCSQMVTFGNNLDSKAMGAKAIIKIANRYFADEEVNKIALVAPSATLIEIRNFAVASKTVVQVPNEIVSIVKCFNPNCITNHENIVTQFNVISKDELKLQFIGPFLWFVNYITDKYKPFTQRSLSIKTDSVESSGLVDFMIATGKSRPKEPFFFLHEYKQQHPSKKNDPLGQLLIAMVAAQEKNGNNHPIYGVIVEGRYWYFVVLHNKEYVVSPSYDATKEEIFQIYAILCKVKDYIELILSENKYPLS